MEEKIQEKIVELRKQAILEEIEKTINDDDKPDRCPTCGRKYERMDDDGCSYIFERKGEDGEEV